MYNQIYSIVEDFIKAVEQDKNFSFLLKNWNGKRGPKRRLSITQVISLNLLRFTINCFIYAGFIIAKSIKKRIGLSFY